MRLFCLNKSKSEQPFLLSILSLYLTILVKVVTCQNNATSSSSSTTTAPSSSSTTSAPSSSTDASEFIRKCDYNLFKNGCPDPMTTICDKTRNECICRPGVAVRIEGRCQSFKSVDESCFSSKECDQIGAKCINAFGEVDAFDNLIGRPLKDLGGVSGSSDSISSSHPSANLFFNLYAGYCQCPAGFYHNQDKKKCQKRLIGTPCRNATDCYSKPHVICDPIEGKCFCDPGYSLDIVSDQCKLNTLIAAGVVPHPGGPSSTLNAIDTRHLNPRATPICEYGLIWDQSIRKCVPLIHWENNRTWSALVWKVAVLCVVLVLLMMLASGIQRARQNENLINWSRALEIYAARNGVLDPDAVTSDGFPQRLPHRTSSSSRHGVMLVMPTPPPQYSASAGREISLTVLPSDDPPTYEEAIRCIGTSSPSTATTTMTTTTIMMINSTSGPSTTNTTTGSAIIIDPNGSPSSNDVVGERKNDNT